MVDRSRKSAIGSASKEVFQMRIQEYPRFSGLKVQPGLAHRGGLDPGDAPLFPHEGMFEAIGGTAAVASLVDGLYDRIEADALLRPAFLPDLTNEREKL